MRMARRTAWLASVLGLALGWAHQASAQAVAAPPEAAPVASQASTVREAWYTVELLGQRSGWMRSTQTTTSESITSESEIVLRIKREAVDLKISVQTRFVETPEGKPISMRSVQAIGTQPLEQEWEFTPTGVKATSRQNGNVRETRAEAPEGEWLCPAAAERFVQARRNAGDKSITLRTIDPSVGLKAITVTRAEAGAASLEILGKKIEASRAKVTMSGLMGVDSVEYTDAQGELVKSETTLGGLAIVMTLATKAEALGGAGAAPPEMMISTFVTPDRPIENPRRLGRGEYVLSIGGGEVPDLPGTGSQSFTRMDAAHVRVGVDAGMPNPAPAADGANKALLEPSSVADTRDEKVQAVYRRALARMDQDAGPPRRAESLRRFVHAFIRTKDLSVGFATASETARTGVGDCSEHGVLLATLLRCDGIPARVASGLIYVESGGRGVFGYHMWAQALLDVDGRQRWVDLDATLPDATPYDATHITLGVSDLAGDDPLMSMMNVATMLGRLQISIPQAAKAPEPAPDAR